MKIELFRKGLSGLIKPGTTAATAMICGFWVTQFLALYFVSGSICGIEPKSTGALFLGLFVILFISHCARPWSKLAAFFGLASLCLFTGYMAYLCTPIPWLRVPPVGATILLSLALILAGILLEAETYRQWVIKTQHLPTNFRHVISTFCRPTNARNSH